MIRRTLLEPFLSDFRMIKSLLAHNSEPEVHLEAVCGIRRNLTRAIYSKSDFVLQQVPAADVQPALRAGSNLTIPPSHPAATTS